VGEREREIERDRDDVRNISFSKTPTESETKRASDSSNRAFIASLYLLLQQRA